MAEDLRLRAARGATLLAARQGILAVAAAGYTALLLRYLGPTDYGVFVTVQSVVAFTLLLGYSAAAQVIRAAPRDLTASWSATVVVAVCAGLVLMLAAPWLAHAIRAPALVAPLWAGGPIAATGIAAVARIGFLDRTLAYETVSALETLPILAGYALGAAGVIGGGRYWAALGGMAAGFGLMLAAGLWATRGFPLRPGRPPGLAGPIGDILSYTAARALFHGRLLINPLVVGPLLGLQAVGVVGAALKVAEAVAGLRIGLARVAFTLMSRFPAAAAAIAALAVDLQTTVLGAAYVLAILTLPALLGILGPEWTPVIALFPYVALAFLLQAYPGVLSGLLFARHRDGPIVALHGAYLVLLAGTAWVAVRGYGLIGYAAAEAAAIGAAALAWVAVTRVRAPWVPLGATGLGLFGGPAAAGVALALLAVRGRALWRRASVWDPQAPPAEPDPAPGPAAQNRSG